MIHPLLRDTHAARGTRTLFGSNGVSLVSVGKDVPEGEIVAEQLGEFSNLAKFLVDIAPRVSAGVALTFDQADRLETILKRLNEEESPHVRTAET